MLMSWLYLSFSNPAYSIGQTGRKAFTNYLMK